LMRVARSDTYRLLRLSPDTSERRAPCCPFAEPSRLTGPAGGPSQRYPSAHIVSYHSCQGPGQRGSPRVVGGWTPFMADVRVEIKRVGMPSYIGTDAEKSALCTRRHRRDILSRAVERYVECRAANVREGIDPGRE